MKRMLYHWYTQKYTSQIGKQPGDSVKVILREII